MKKYFVEAFTECDDGRNYHEMFECESYTMAKNWTGECIRLEDVNTYKNGKKKPVRKQLSRGKYITIEKMRHWKRFEVVVFENGTDNVVDKWNG